MMKWKGLDEHSNNKNKYEKGINLTLSGFIICMGVKKEIKNKIEFKNPAYYVIKYEKNIIINLKSNSEYIFITTRDNDLKVYHYSRENRTLKETGMNFSEYVADLIKRYNPELEELKDVSVSGDIINIW